MKTANEPLVSINIPTFNEEKALPFTLDALTKQNYSNFELIVVDSNSKDDTKKIASEYNANVINYDGKLLGARYIGIKESNGDYILLLDADQILNKNAIIDSINKINNYDMLVLEEDSYKPRTYIQKKISIDRKLNHSQLNALDPITGGLLPRFFKKNILKAAFKKIPRDLFNIVVSGDHAIIYYEAYKVSKKVGIVKDAVSHIEDATLGEFFKHNYRFGKSTKELVDTGYYNELFKGISIKKNTFQSIKDRIIIMVFLRSLAFRLGYIFG